MSKEPTTSPVPAAESASPCTSIDGQGLKELIEAAMTWVKTNQQMINALNVFPVPDGDTGTNMLLTMQAAYNEIAASGEKNVGKMAHSVAQGALMGARGNSGVILSQIWRGFARGLDSQDTMDVESFARSLEESRATAYKGVVRPVEGTILTVIKDVSVAARQAAQETTDLMVMIDKVVLAADESVQHTPELLPILKQAGVVDSGGKGLFFLLEGMQRHLKGLPLETAIATVQPLSAMNLEDTMEEVEPGQDYEVVVDFRPYEELNLEKFYEGLAEIGTSIQVGEGDGMYRMHIHVATDKKYDPIEYTLKLGTVTKVAMENLIAQVEDRQDNSDQKINLAPVEPGHIAVVAISPGKGISRIFASLGAAAIVEGGQTMNPSTEEILHALENLPTDKIIILPNNKNIIMAAQSAASVTVKKVAVIPAKTVPQGLSAMLRLVGDADFDHIVSEMNEAITEVETGEVTVATRTVEINDVDVKSGEVIALLNGKLVNASPTLEEAVFNLLESASTDDRERITVFYGANISKNDVNRITDDIRNKYPNHEIEVHEGGQPHYQFIFMIE